MIDIETDLSTLYVMVDDFCKAKWPLELIHTGPQASLSRSEVVTLAVFGHCDPRRQAAWNRAVGRTSGYRLGWYGGFHLLCAINQIGLVDFFQGQFEVTTIDNHDKIASLKKGCNFFGGGAGGRSPSLEGA